MRKFASRILAAMSRAIGRMTAAIGKAIGAREAMLLSGLALLGYGAGSIYWPAGFFLPGAVLLFCAIIGLR